MPTSTLLILLTIVSAEQMVPEEERRFLPGSVSLFGQSADALQAPAGMREPRRAALRARSPAMQFGFQNFDRSKVERDGLQILSPIAGAAKRDKDTPLKKFKKDDNAVLTGTPQTLAVLGAAPAGFLAIILAALFADPALTPDSLPFEFLNRWYPPAIETKARVKAAVEKKEAENKAQAEKEAKKKAEAEAKKAAEAAAEAKNAPQAKAAAR